MSGAAALGASTKSGWFAVRDGDADARAIFHRHYSYKPYADGREPKLFVGPGEKMVLRHGTGRALFIWRKFICGDGQEGVNCAVFRNEGAGLSSRLIGEADAMADARWPEQRHFTYVNPRKVESENPGYCFLMAGWRRVGITKCNRLLILARTANSREDGSLAEPAA